MPTVEQKVDSLKKAIEDFVKYTGIEFNKVYNLQMQNGIDIKNLNEEMKVFKDEMLDFKGEMLDFKDEMSDFKDEMSDFKDEMRTQNKDMNIRWGELANKMGTMVEDLVAPSLPRIVREEYDIEITDLIVRRTIKLPDGKRNEYDAIAVAGSYLFLNSTKSTLRHKDIEAFKDEIKGFREIFPEYGDKKIIGLLASLYVDEGFIGQAEKQGFFVLGVGEHLMDIKNSEGFKPKEW